MPRKEGNKFATKHSFGKKRRKTKTPVIAGKPGKQCVKGLVDIENDHTHQHDTHMDSDGTADATGDATGDANDDATVPMEEALPSASKRKLSVYFDGDCQKVPNDFDDEHDTGTVTDIQVAPKGNIITDVDCLNNVIAVLKCPKCDGRGVSLIQGEHNSGSAVKLTLNCVTCGVINSGMSSKKDPGRNAVYDVNKRLPAAAAVSGIGFEQMKTLFVAMDLPPPMHHKTWQFRKQDLNSSATRAADKHLQEAAAEIRKAYADLHIEADADGVLDLLVSMDGSWQKRGWSSHNGIAVVVELHTGLIIDYEVLSNYCVGCDRGPKPDADNYEDWQRSHEADCQKNVDTSSSAMEPEAAVRMWERSVSSFNFRYTSMIADGDCKTQTILNDRRPYGPNITIDKAECINHVSKRMGTALRTLVASRKAQKLPISGKGKLTDGLIKKLTNYYGRAIKDNTGNLEGMRNAVWASFFHTLSTDTDPHHSRCPTGDESWCFYQRALARNEEPREHRKEFPRDICQAIVPIYERLGSESLLKKCLSGKTSNINESIHSVVWNICPKNRWCCKRTVETAVALCVTRYNKGASSVLDVLLELRLISSANVDNYVDGTDMKRVQKSSLKCTAKAQQRREAIDKARRVENEERREREGEVYAAVAF